jgi:hypothetical protein
VLVKLRIGLAEGMKVSCSRRTWRCALLSVLAGALGVASVRHVTGERIAVESDARHRLLGSNAVVRQRISIRVLSHMANESGLVFRVTKREAVSHTPDDTRHKARIARFLHVTPERFRALDVRLGDHNADRLDREVVRKDSVSKIHVRIDDTSSRDFDLRPLPFIGSSLIRVGEFGGNSGSW